MYFNFSLAFTFIGIGFVSWISGIRLFAMSAFWCSVLFALVKYSFGYVILTAIEFLFGAFIAYVITSEKPLK
jgi:uncharacterized membrane protein YedE/YeeE